MVSTKTKLLFCTEEVPVFEEGQNFSSIRYMDPITKFFKSYLYNRCMQPAVPKCCHIRRRQLSKMWRNAEEIQS